MDQTALPGTTTDHQLGIVKDYHRYVQDYHLSGGPTANSIGIYSLDYNLEDITTSNLGARKSWFALEDTVYNVASKVSNTSGKVTKSIVDNRMLLPNQELYVNGVNIIEYDNGVIVDANIDIPKIEDQDGDGILDIKDKCPTVAASPKYDLNLDGCVDVNIDIPKVEDQDGDGILSNTALFEINIVTLLVLLLTFLVRILIKRKIKL